MHYLLNLDTLIDYSSYQNKRRKRNIVIKKKSCNMATFADLGETAPEGQTAHLIMDLTFAQVLLFHCLGSTRFQQNYHFNYFSDIKISI